MKFKKNLVFSAMMAVMASCFLSCGDDDAKSQDAGCTLCPEGQVCDPNTGDCVDEAPASSCENLAKPADGEGCAHVGNAGQYSTPV